jgi:hypothetical protein
MDRTCSTKEKTWNILLKSNLTDLGQGLVVCSCEDYNEKV